MKRNPFDVAERWLSRIGYTLLAIVTLALLAAILVVIPVGLMMDGVPWWQAFMPLFVLVGGLAFSLLISLAAFEIEKRWKRASRNWERKHR